MPNAFTQKIKDAILYGLPPSAVSSVDYGALTEKVGREAGEKGRIKKLYSKYLKNRDILRGRNTLEPDDTPMTEEEFGKAEVKNQTREYLRDVKPEREAQMKGIADQERAQSMRDLIESQARQEILAKRQDEETKHGRTLEVERVKARSKPEYLKSALSLRPVVEKWGGAWDENKDLAENVFSVKSRVPKEKHGELDTDLQTAYKTAFGKDEKDTDTAFIKNAKYIAQTFGIPETEAYEKLRTHMQRSREEVQLDAYNKSLQAGVEPSVAQQNAMDAGMAYDVISGKRGTAWPSTPEAKNSRFSLKGILDLIGFGDDEDEQTEEEIGAEMIRGARGAGAGPAAAPGPSGITREQAIAELRRRGKL